MAALNFEDLNLFQLDILLGHLRLGEPHLKKILNTNQFKELIQRGLLKVAQHDKIQSNKKEKSGSVALVINTVVTSVFGAWMGFSGFMGLQLSWIMLVSMTILALIISAIAGYYSFKLTAVRAKAAINAQKIYNMQLAVIKLMLTKKKEQIDSYINYLNHTLQYFHNNTPGCQKENLNYFSFENKEDFSNWFADLQDVITKKAKLIREEEIYAFYAERLEEIYRNLEEIIQNNPAASSCTAPPILAAAIEPKEKPTTCLDENSSFLQVLADPAVRPKPSRKKKSWLSKNILPLIAGLIPTILGGFASMFVVLAGGPDLAKQLGLKAIENFLHNPKARAVEFSIALMLTIYYGSAFIYNNYKAFLRDEEAEKTKKDIVHQEQQVIDLENKYILLQKIKDQLQRFISIYTAQEKISSHWQSAKQQLEQCKQS